MSDQLIQPFANGHGHELRLIAECVWSRPKLLAAASHLWTCWADNPAFREAEIVATQVTPTVHSVVTLLALIQLGVPFVPLHPGWSPVQCQQVLTLTGALLLPADAAPPVSAAEATAARAQLQRPVAAESALALVFTSGSTGAPKGAILSHRALASSAHVTQQCLGLGHDEVFGLSLSLAHVGGLAILTRAATFGGNLALPLANGADGFDATRFVSRCAQTATTVVSLVPTQLRRICAARLRAPSSLKLALVGGAHAPAALLQTALDLGWPVHRTYGLTEAGSQVATDRTPATMGPLPLLPHVEARVEPGGRLALRGQALFSGYFGQPPRRPSEWFVTSDLATVGEGGIVPLGRADDLVISGGENIYPDEVDAALAAAPGVKSACSFARESLEWGHELCAAVVPEPDFDAARLVAHLRVVLPSFKVPKAWILVSELPSTATGKISRPLCQQAYAADCRPFG